jgi:hypothetical protein
MKDVKKDKLITKWIDPQFTHSLYKVELPSRRRNWMDLDNGHAYRCLPLSVANGFGWDILNPIKFEAIWNGDPGIKDAILFNFYPQNKEEEDFIKDNSIGSHFGNGIITWSALNFVLKTTSGHNIFIKAPTNHFKHGARSLEAIIESDWLPYPFTLNWKITKKHVTIKFEKDEPIACFFPIPRYYLESFDTDTVTGETESKFNKEMSIWASKRGELTYNEFYSRGLEDSENKKVFEDHQRAIRGCPFLNKIKENNDGRET